MDVRESGGKRHHKRGANQSGDDIAEDAYEMTAEPGRKEKPPTFG